MDDREYELDQNVRAMERYQGRMARTLRDEQAQAETDALNGLDVQFLHPGPVTVKAGAVPSEAEKAA